MRDMSDPIHAQLVTRIQELEATQEEATITTDQARDIELAIRDVGHMLEEAFDALYWLKQGEDRAIMMDNKQAVRDALHRLNVALNGGNQ